MRLQALTACSGIGAPEEAARPLGWNFVACSEIEPFPSAVLAHHYPHVPNLGDMTTADWAAWAYRDPVPRQTRSRWPALQGARQLEGNDRRELALGAHRPRCGTGRRGHAVVNVT